MKELLSQIFGPTQPCIFIFLMLIAGVSQYLTIYYKSKTTYKKVKDTPVHFSLKFMTQDNLQKLFVGFLIAYIGLRGSVIWFQSEATFIIALGIGPAGDFLAGFFRSKEDGARK
jgi:hypothetical protein